MSKSTQNFFAEKKEWSKIKDSILGCYLKPYFTKIQYTKKEIVYIDGFAGKGIFDDGSLGSPLIAYNIAKEVNNDLNIKFYFIENKFFKELGNNVRNLNDVKVITGNYEDNIVELIKNNVNKNLFVYIDPFGIKNLNFSYLKKLNESSLYSAEFLMNLNSFGFIREGCRLLKADFTDFEVDHFFKIYLDETKEFKESNNVENMIKIAGGDYWINTIKKLKKHEINGYQAEKEFVDKYCEKLKEYGKFDYVINVPIRLKVGSPPKYRMIFATNHVDGIILMNDNMCNRFEELSNIQNNGTSSLFLENTENEFITEDIIKNNITSLLNETYIDYYDFFIKYINIYGLIKTKILNDILKKLEASNMIDIKRIPQLTEKGKKSKFIMPSGGKNTMIKIAGEVK